MLPFSLYWLSDRISTESSLVLWFCKSLFPTQLLNTSSNNKPPYSLVSSSSIGQTFTHLPGTISNENLVPGRTKSQVGSHSAAEVRLPSTNICIGFREKHISQIKF